MAHNRVFCLGIGAAADRALVKGMARAGRGTAAFTTQGEAITPKVIRQLRAGLQPCISEVSVTWGQEEITTKEDKEEEIVETKKTLFGHLKKCIKLNCSEACHYGIGWLLDLRVYLGPTNRVIQ